VQAQVYEAEGNDAQTYLLLYRHAKLVLDHLANHPEKALPENKKALAAASAAVHRDLAKLELLRPRIAKRHEDYRARRKAQQEALEALEGRGAHSHSFAHELDSFPIQKADLKRQSYERTPLEAAQNRSLAARLAQREVWRRDHARRSGRQAAVPEEGDYHRRTGGMWADWEREMRPESREDDDLSRQLQEVARLQEGHGTPNFSVCVGHAIGQNGTDWTATDLNATHLYLSLPFDTTQNSAREMVRIRR
jgi:STAM-binding protein